MNVYEDLTCCGRISATVKIKLAADERRGNFFQGGDASSIQAMLAECFGIQIEKLRGQWGGNRCQIPDQGVSTG